jgi:hypothetical protein
LPKTELKLRNNVNWKKRRLIAKEWRNKMKRKEHRLKREKWQESHGKTKKISPVFKTSKTLRNYQEAILEVRKLIH